MAEETVSVKFVAEVAGFLTGVQKAGAGLKKLGQEAGKISAVLTGLGTVMVREAAKYDRQVAGAVKGLQGAYSAMAVEIGRMLLPTIRELTAHLSQLVNWFRSLSPETKAQAAHFIALGASVLGVVAIAGKLGGLIGSVAGIGAAILPILPLAFALGAAFVAVVAVMEALDLTWSDVWKNVKATALNVWDWLGKTFGTVIDGMKAAIKTVLSVLGQAVGKISELAKAVGLEGFGDFSKDLGAWLENLSTESGYQSLVDDAKDTAAKVIDRLKDIPAHIKTMMKNLLPDLSKFSGAVSAGPSIADQSKGAEATWKAIQASNRSEHNAAQKALTDGMKEFDDELKKAAEAAKTLAESQQQAKDALIGNAIGKAGKMGGAANDAMTGFTAGGPWGALIAVIGNLLMSSKQFEKILKAMDRGFQMLSDLFGEVLAPIEEVVHVLNAITRSFSGPLKVIFQKIGQLAGWIFEALFDITKSIAAAFIDGAIIVVKVIRWFVEAWNNIKQSIAQIVYDVANALLPDGPMKNAWRALAQSIAGDATSLNNLDTTITDLEGAQKAVMNATWDGILAAEKKAAADEEAAEAAQKVTEALTNMPAGFRINAARFAASGSAGGSAAGSGLASTFEGTGLGAVVVGGNKTGRGPGLEGTQQRGGDTFIFNVAGSLAAMDELVSMAEKRRASRGAQRTGLATVG